MRRRGIERKIKAEKKGKIRRGKGVVVRGKRKGE